MQKSSPRFRSVRYFICEIFGMLQNKHAIIYFLACSCVHTICLHLEQAFETVFEQMKLDTDVTDETFA